MAKQTPKEKTAKRKVRREEVLSLESLNYKIILAGVFIIILGYISLSSGPWDGFFALTLAPFLLVIGYCIIIPFGIIYRKKKPESTETISSAEQVAH
ncbi:MAG: hypothetical protein PHP42_13095 [Bacteroidota bacterium]|nr:hypothetical protein [Bacteroidota bacterium]